ncbi:MAG TPA: hypothetical protein VMS93_12965 [Candidatus Saccharimonadales bacterium]|nr:hypothetical protein [Candidatus Saccharimonadales bacterium]
MPSKSPKSRPDFRRIGVVAGVALVACAGVFAANLITSRISEAPPSPHRAGHVPRTAHAHATVACPPFAVPAPVPGTPAARSKPTAAAAPAAAHVVQPAVRRPAPAAALATAPKPLPVRTVAAEPLPKPQPAHVVAAAQPAPPARVTRAPAPPAPLAAHAPARAPVPGPAARRTPTPLLAARPAAPAVAVVRRPAPAPAARPAVRPVQKAGLLPAASPPAAPAAAPARPAAAPAPGAPAEAADPDADFGIALPLPSQYAYNPDGRRDPFQSLLRGEFDSEQGGGGQPLVDVADLTLMGVMAVGSERYAMVEDSKHHGFTLRVGDPVLNGRVTRIEDDCITVNLSSYGETQTVRLHLNSNRTTKVGGKP